MSSKDSQIDIMSIRYYKDHTSELRIENTSESDHCSYEATLAVTNKAQKKFWDYNRMVGWSQIDKPQFVGALKELSCQM